MDGVRPPRIILIALGLVLVVALAWVLGPGATWVLVHVDGVSGLTGKDLAAALDALRGRALTVATGLIALVAVFYTARNADTTRQGHITDRYTKAIEQLGTDKLDVRLGGIFALERIARDSPRDHSTVMEVLAAFVREHSRDRDDIGEQGEVGELEGGQRPVQTDIQAALTVIGRRNVRQDRGRIDLRGADLRNAYLNRANLTSANLARTNLTNASLRSADLKGANLYRAIINGADLTEANLTEAYLCRADLTNATLTAATLTGADLTEAVGLTRQAEIHGTKSSEPQEPEE